MNSEKTEQSRADQTILLVGQGFGLGRIPFAPGTFGTLLGLFEPLSGPLWDPPGSLWAALGLVSAAL